MSLRFFQKAPRPSRLAVEGPWTALHRSADRHVPALARTIREWLAEAKIDRSVLALARGGADSMSEEAVPWRAWAEDGRLRLEPIVLGALQGGGRATWRETEVAKELAGRFSPENARLLAWVSRRVADLVTNLSNEGKAALRHVIQQAIHDGVDLRRDPKAIERILRVYGPGLDRRRQGTVLRFIDAQRTAGTSEIETFRRARTLRDRLVKDRARVIARHETMLATNAGQQEAWDQAEALGFLPRIGVVQEWLVAPGIERTCDICKGMSGQRRPRGQLFTMPGGGSVSYPPAHVLCRCCLIIVETDNEELLRVG